MLQSIRDKTHGWIAGIIISLLILSFALWGIHSYLAGGSVSDVVAKVNGTAIKQGQLTVAYERLRRQYELQKANNELLTTGSSDLKNQALKSLINLEVLKQSSLNQNYRISQTQVENYLEEMPDFKVNGQFSASRFQQILSAMLYSTTDFLELIRTTLLIDQPRLGIIFSSFSLPNEVTDSIGLINQERDIQYTLLPLTLFSGEPITVSEDLIQNYYKKHIEEFKKPEQVSVEYILVSAKDLMSKIQPTEQELKNYYSENAESFNLPAKWKFVSISIPLPGNATAESINQAEKQANDIYQKAEKGTDFSVLGKEYSIGKDNINTHDYIAINNMPAEMQTIFLSATKVGQVIKPIKTRNGFLIVKILDYKKSEAQSYGKVKELVKEAVVAPKSEEQFANMKEKLANITYEHPDSLTPAADALGLSIQTSGLFTKDKGNEDISNNLKVRDAAFSSDVLEVKNNSDVIPINADSVVVLRIKSHTPASTLPLVDVQNLISEKLKSSEVESKTSKVADEIVTKLQAGATLDDMAQQYHLVWTNSGMLSRHSTKVDSAILDAAFDLPKSKNEKTYTAVKVPNGYAIVVLNSIQNGNLSRTEDYDVFAEQVQNTQGLLEYDLYKQSVVKQAKIKIENQD